MAPPGFDENRGLLQGVEDLSVQELVAQPRVETLDITIFPRRTRLDKGGPGANRGDPSPHGPGDELRAVVGADVARNAAPDAGAVVELQTPPLRLFAGHLQPLAPPQALDPLVVDLPAGFAQQGGDPAIAVTTVESSLTSVFPYARLAIGEGLDIWGLVGAGSGDLTVSLRRGPPSRFSVIGRDCAIGSGHLFGVHQGLSGHDRRCRMQWRSWDPGERARFPVVVGGARLTGFGSSRRAIGPGYRYRLWRGATTSTPICFSAGGGGTASGLVPVVVEPSGARPPLADAVTSDALAAGRMEIALADGSRVIVDREVDGSALARVLSVLARR